MNSINEFYYWAENYWMRSRSIAYRFRRTKFHRVLNGREWKYPNLEFSNSNLSRIRFVCLTTSHSLNFLYKWTCKGSGLPIQNRRYINYNNTVWYGIYRKQLQTKRLAEKGTLSTTAVEWTSLFKPSKSHEYLTGK